MGVYFYSPTLFTTYVYYLLFCVCVTPTDTNGRPAHVRGEDNQALNMFLVWQLNPWVQKILHVMSTCSNIPLKKKKTVFIYRLPLLYKQISYIHLILGYILQKYIKTGAEKSRSFIEKVCFIIQTLSLKCMDLVKKMKKNILVGIFIRIKVIELGSTLKNDFLDQNNPKQPCCRHPLSCRVDI